MKKIMFVFVAALILSGCSSSAPAASAPVSSSALSLEEKFDRYVAAESDPSFSFNISMNDDSVHYLIWKDGIGEMYDSDPGLAFSMVDARNAPAYERFVEANLDGVDLFFTLVDDRDYERILYSYRNGELWYRLEDQKSSAQAEVGYLLIENLLHDGLKKVFDDYRFERDGDLITAYAWKSPVGQVCEQLQSGDMTLEKEWIDVRNSFEEMLQPIMDFAEKEGVPFYLDFYVVDERDDSVTLLYYSDGKLIKDYSGVK